MTLQHDSEGFLIGDPIDLRRAVSLLGSIQSDVRAMRQALAGASGSSPRVSSRADRAPAIPGRTSASAAKAETTAAVDRQIAAAAKASMPAAIPKGRDSKGRFVASSTDSGSLSSGQRADNQSLSGGFAKRVASAVTEGMSNSEEAEPTVKAFKEVAEPLKRGYRKILGDAEAKRQSTWFGRLWDELKGIRTEQTIYEKATVKSLKAIENKPVTPASVNNNILPNLPPSLPSVPGAGSLLGGAGRLIKGAAKGALRRLPLIGALLGGVGAAANIVGSESDDTKSRREKDSAAGKAVGGLAGSIGGMAAGAKLGAMAGSLLGPVGTIVGGVVGGAAGMFFGDLAGQVIGDKVGGWVADLRDADIPGKITGAWSSFVNSAKAGWETVTGLFKSAYDGLKSLPVIGKAIQAAEEAGKKAVETAGSVAAAAKDKTAQGVQAVKDKALDVGANTADAAKNGAAWIGENTTVGKGVTWLAEAGKGYNIVQRADGTLEKREGARNWRNNNPGNIEFGDFAKKHGAIGSDGRFAVFPDYESGRKAKEGLIFDGKNYKDKTLSDAIARYAPPGENDTKAYQAAVLSAVGGQNKRMGEYSPAERAQIMDAMERQEGFQVGKVSVVRQSAVTTQIPQVVTSPLPTIPAMPVPPQIPDAPQIKVPLSSGESGRNIAVTPPANEPGQDLSNRRIAHVVTGGYSSGS